MIPGSANPLLLASAAAAGGYEIERSLRFNLADTAYLSRTPSTAGNRKTWTWAGWVKRSKFGTFQYLFGAGASQNTDQSAIRFNTDETIDFFYFTGSFQWRLNTAQVFRDPSSWYHIVAVCDTDNATANNRTRLYVNGSEVTVFASRVNASLGSQSAINRASEHRIGISSFPEGSYAFPGYLADVHFIDGQALDPTSFTEVDADTGQLVPIAYSGTYGTNGFHLPFSDNSTAAALGTDTSGNSNTWTVNNISVAAGAGNDSLVDTPTNYGTDTGAGGEVRGNYCTLNPLHLVNGGSLSNGNLTGVFTGSGAAVDRDFSIGTIAVSSGKWYYEVLANCSDTARADRNITGWMIAGNYLDHAESSGFLSLKVTTLNKDGTASTYGSGYSNGDIIGVSIDLDNNTAQWYVNGVGQGLTTIDNHTYLPMVGHYDGLTTTGTLNVNFGQRPWAFTPPAGFKALCTTNLPAPVVAKPSTVMDVKLYTGNGSTQTISGLDFSPDLVWVKSRNSIKNNVLVDTVRGGSNTLFPDNTNGEYVRTSVTSFTSDGFGLGDYTNSNSNSITFAAWTWDAGSSTVTNTDGSITSQVRANPTAGFSIVSWTGTGAAGSVGHGLNVTPSLWIQKRRDNTGNWNMYHSSTGVNEFLNFTTAASGTVSGLWGAGPSPTVMNLSSVTSISASGASYVAYCFAPVTGYSNGFSYTGNGSTDGSFVYLGFRPRLILLKCSSTTGNWTLLDTAREGYNVDNDPLYPNLANAEGTTDLLDITSNGFKLRTTDASVNSNAATYIGFAWAESPFNYSRAR